MPRLPGFVGPSYQAQAPVVNTERTVNLYPEKRDGGTPKAQTWLYATPGLGSFATTGSGPHRASFAQNGRAFVISGAELYEVFADGTATLRGTVVAGTDQGTIVSNGDGGNQLLVVVGGYGYVYDLTADTLTLIADPDFPQGTAAMCAFLDGYGILLLEDSATFQLSALEDFTDWDALDVAQKSQTADRVRSIVTDYDHKILWLLGTQTIEIWWDAGAAAFPFEPVPNSIIAQGAASRFGVVQPKGALIWIAENQNGGRTAFSGVGSTTTRISTHGVEAVWAEYETVADCIAWTYDWRGHTFCVFTFSTANATWVYDLTEQQWHEWLEWDKASGTFMQHLGRTHSYVFDRHLVGSRETGALYRLDATVLADAGTTIRRMRRSPHVAADGRWVFCSRLEFDFQVGVGLSTGQGADPQVMLRISRDGGRTYGNERWASLGTLGKYLTRVRFLRNGRWRDGVIEVTITDPVVVALTECWADLEAA